MGWRSVIDEDNMFVWVQIHVIATEEHFAGIVLKYGVPSSEVWSELKKFSCYLICSFGAA